jgi:hypothetical protein
MTEPKTSNMTSVYSTSNPHDAEMPEQINENYAPGTYEKDGGKLTALSRGLKKIVGAESTGLGPKHRSVKPHGMTGQEHEEAAAQDIYGLHDALHEGTENGRAGSETSQTVHTDTHSVPHTGTEGIVASTKSTGSETQAEKLMDKIHEKKPIYDDRDLQHSRDELKHVDAPDAHLSEGAKTAYLEAKKDKHKDTDTSSVSASSGTIASDSHRLESGTTGSQQTKDPAEGVTEGVKAAFIADQRERAALGDEKFEQGRENRAKEGDVQKGIGQKILEGIQSVAQTATQMITGPKVETQETGVYKSEPISEVSK